jgi:hypothetical protein
MRLTDVHRTIVLALATLALTACASSTAVLDDATVDAGIDAAIDIPPVDTPGVDVVPHTYVQTIGPITLAPTEEQTVCVIRRLGNLGHEYLRRIRAHIGPGSHHLVFYRAVETTEQPDPFPCTGFSGIQDINTIDSPMIIAQQQDALLEMPAGVGMNLGANQMVRIELHAINVTAAPISVAGTVTLDTVEATTFVVPADVMFWGPYGFVLPPHQISEQHYFHRPLSGAHIFALTSHTHHLGTLATISLATDPSGDPSMSIDTMELHRSMSWSDPPLTQFDPPLTVNTAESGLHLECHYNNTTDAPVRWGESFNDEMCFMWAYYYPAPFGTQVCTSNLPGFADGGVVCFPQ